MIITQNIESLSKVVDKYDLFIIDQWGVMHDGKKGYPNAIKCIKSLIKLNKKLIIISNSSKRKNTSFDRLSELGFNKNDFVEMVTSGEIIWQNLYSKSDSFFKNLGPRCFHLYDNKKEDGKKYEEGLDYDFVNNITDADFILGCATSSELKTLDYVPLLKEAIHKNIPFVCANPDFETVESSQNHLIICMGTIAELYKDFGGSVFIMGKPSTKIYHEATKNFVNINKTKILAIGDSIHHDIKGANSFGIDSLLIASGIHKSCFDPINPIWGKKDNDLFKFNIQPTYLCSKLKF